MLESTQQKIKITKVIKKEVQSAKVSLSNRVLAPFLFPSLAPITPEITPPTTPAIGQTR